MQTILVDPYPREMKLIFTPKKLQLLKKNYQLIMSPIEINKIFMKKTLTRQILLLDNLTYPPHF